MLDRFKPENYKSFYDNHIKDKNVLVMGSGPSTTQVNWENLDIDTILTTSFFYLNDKIRSLTNIKHVTLTQLVDLYHPNLIEFLNKNKQCQIGFEVNGPVSSMRHFKKFTTEYKDRVVDYWTTDHSNCLHIGVGGRLCLFAMNFLPKTLYYVGIDGTSKTPEKDPVNSFRPKSMYKGYDRLNHEQTPGILKMNEILFNYSQQNNIKIYNLGEGFDYNISTEYSKIHYPLTKEIINKIKTQ
jgi:hypothetical protein